MSNNPASTSPAKYCHSDYLWRRRLCRFLLKTIGFTLLVRIKKVEGLENVPTDGPAILMMNHIAFVDPLVLINVSPRHIVPLAKTEAYDYPVVGIFPRLWGVIPVARQGVDRRAVAQALDVLKAGEIILVAPEGTRQPALSQPREGAAYLASRSGAPIIPVAMEQTNGFPTFPFSRRWWAPGARVKFGRPFRYKAGLARARGDQLKHMTDEAMYVLSGMLPEKRRGDYSDLSKATEDTIEFL